MIVIHDTGIAASYKPEQFDIVNGYHQRKWNMKSPITGYFVCYNYFIGTTGALVKVRGDDERPGCTMNDDVNDHAIQVVLAGSFEEERPTERQIATLKNLVSKLQEKFNIQAKNVIGHKEASGTTCPGKYIMELLTHYRNNQ